MTKDIEHFLEAAAIELRFFNGQDSSDDFDIDNIDMIVSYLMDAVRELARLNKIDCPPLGDKTS